MPMSGHALQALAKKPGFVPAGPLVVACQRRVGRGRELS